VFLKAYNKVYSVFTLPITINNRREWMAELQDTRKQKESMQFLVEMTKTAEINLLSIDSSAVLSCFLVKGFDVSFTEIETRGYFDDVAKSITVQFFTRNKNVENSQTQAKSKEVEKPSFYADLNDDLGKEESKKDELVTSLNVPFLEVKSNTMSNDIQFSLVHHTHGIYCKAKLNQAVTSALFDMDCLYVKLIFEFEGLTYEQAITLTLCHPNEFLGMALDFGSEASQMVVSRYANNASLLSHPTNEDLFQKIKDFHLNKGWIEPSNLPYYQEEKNTPFYKSIFFLKYHLGSTYLHFAAENYVLEQQECLKMLVDRSSSKRLTDELYKQLPNLKIIHRQDNILSSIKFQYYDQDENYLIDIKLNQITQKVNNTILKTMIESFLKKELIQYKMSNRCVRLTLLVPNIYDSEYVRETQIHLNQIFADIAKQEGFQHRLKAWEISAISESDAAFLGYMSKSNVQIVPNHDYVIIDAGKGTTDFSVIKTGQLNVFDVKPMYRNGFAGAGNLITNAIFETLLHFIRESNRTSNGVLQFIQTEILNSLENDLAVRNDFFAELERLKFNFTQNKNVKSTWLKASSGSITFDKLITPDVSIFTIIDLLKQIDEVADFYGYIHNVCDVISEKVMIQLSMVQSSATNIKLFGAVLTGRGFLFKPLATMMINKLVEKLTMNISNIVVLEGNELKDVCIKGVFNKSIRLNAELVGYPIQRIKIKHSEIPILKSVDQKVNVWWKKVFGSMDDFAKYKYEFVEKNQLSEAHLQQSEIIIGANRYSINEPDFFAYENHQAMKISIDYTSDGYKVRRLLGKQIEQIVSLEPIFYPDNPDLHLIVPSLFPNYIDKQYLASLGTNIAFYEEKKLLDAENFIKDGTPMNDLLFGQNRLAERDDLLF
jgi:hypothetical protein